MTLKERARALLDDIREFHRGKTVGVVLGIFGGWFGVLAGFALGWMIDALLAQRETDQSVIDYFENPGPSSFSEPIPGCAAFCGLAVLIVHQNRADRELDEVATPALVAAAALAAFGAEETRRPELEEFARVAGWRPEALNPDLLTESLRARRKRKPGAEKTMEAICAALEELAEADGARELAERIAAELCPARRKKKLTEDPYAILGLAEGAALDEVKTVYRRLAVQFHPDSTAGLTEAQKKSAAEAFMRIDGAYRKIVGKGPL